jgi:hypothetical protein
MQGPLENTEHHHSTFCVSLYFHGFSAAAVSAIAAAAAATIFKQVVGFKPPRRYPSNWIPFGDHPLKLERYRED